MKAVFITGDLIRPNPDGSANQLANIDWLYDLVSYQIWKITNIKPKKLIRKTGLTNLEEWIQTENIMTPCWHLLQSELYMAEPGETLVIGFEMPKNTKHQLMQHGFKYVDIIIHPIRFLDDILPAIQTSGLSTIPDEFCLNDADIYLHANLIKTHVKRVFPVDVANDSALIIGQTKIDKSLFDEQKGFLSLLHFTKEIEEACRKHSNVLFKPHPYQTDPDVLDYMLKNKITITNSNIYALLANENVKSVYAISSSVLYEAKYFDKNVFFFAEKPLTDYIPVKPDLFLTIKFWGKLLGFEQSHEIWLPAVPHRLRKTLDSWWGYPESPYIFRDDLLSKIQNNIDTAANNIHKIYAYKIRRKLAKILKKYF